MRRTGVVSMIALVVLLYLSAAVSAFDLQKMAMYYLPLASRFNQDQLEKAAPEAPLSGPSAGEPASNPAPLIGYQCPSSKTQPTAGAQPPQTVSSRSIET